MNKEEKKILSYINGGYQNDKIYGELSIFHGLMRDWFDIHIKELLSIYYDNKCVQDLKIIKKYIQSYMERCLYKSKYEKLRSSLNVIQRSINEIQDT